MKTSIYLPDDLAEQVREHGISMSEVVQAALRQSVAEAQMLAQTRETIRADIATAVTRMRQVLAEEERAKEAERATGRPVGIRWARDYATPRELRELAGTEPPRRVSWHSLLELIDNDPEVAGRFGQSKYHVYIDLDKPWQAGFRQGATMVWEAVQPILERETRQ